MGGGVDRKRRDTDRRQGDNLEDNFEIRRESTPWNTEKGLASQKR